MIVIHFSYFTAVQLAIIRVHVSLTMHFLLIVLAETFKLYGMY